MPFLSICSTPIHSGPECSFHLRTPFPSVTKILGVYVDLTSWSHPWEVLCPENRTKVSEEEFDFSHTNDIAFAYLKSSRRKCFVSRRQLFACFHWFIDFRALWSCSMHKRAHHQCEPNAISSSNPVELVIFHHFCPGCEQLIVAWCPSNRRFPDRTLIDQGNLTQTKWSHCWPCT